MAGLGIEVTYAQGFDTLFDGSQLHQVPLQLTGLDVRPAATRGGYYPPMVALKVVVGRTQSSSEVLESDGRL